MPNSNTTTQHRIARYHSETENKTLMSSVVRPAISQGYATSRTETTSWSKTYKNYVCINI